MIHWSVHGPSLFQVNLLLDFLAWEKKKNLLGNLATGPHIFIRRANGITFCWILLALRISIITPSSQGTPREHACKLRGSHIRQQACKICFGGSISMFARNCTRDRMTQHERGWSNSATIVVTWLLAFYQCEASNLGLLSFVPGSSCARLKFGSCVPGAF